MPQRNHTPSLGDVSSGVLLPGAKPRVTRAGPALTAAFTNRGIPMYGTRFFAWIIPGLVLLAQLFVLTPEAEAVRIKDIARVSGTRANQLTGYGLVVGLSGTGDSRNSRVTAQTVADMLARQGIRVDKNRLRTGNVAVVMVTASMPVSAKPGSPADVTVSAIGDSRSLSGGQLLMTPLRGVDNKVYALAQGSLAVGGYAVGGSGASASKNSATTALVPGGATIERNVPFSFNEQSSISLEMMHPDFSTASQMVASINRALGGNYARAESAGSVRVDVPRDFRGNLVPFIASIENLDITPDTRARAVVNERTGTVVLGGAMRLSTVAVSHGNLQVVVREGADVSQPAPFSGGRTVAVPRTDISINEGGRRLVLASGATLQELVDSLNRMGATPRDIISILLAVKDAGALQGELVVQ